MLASPAAKVPSTATWWDFTYVAYGLVLAPPGVAIRPQLCGPTVRTGAFFTAARNCGPRYNKLFTDFVGPLLTDVRRGYYLRFVMLISHKFVGPGPNWPHLFSSATLHGTNWPKKYFLQNYYIRCINIIVVTMSISTMWPWPKKGNGEQLTNLLWRRENNIPI